MALPTTNLIARYEPKVYGYSDAQTYDSTHKFSNAVGGADANTNLVNRANLGTHKLSILNGLAVARFSGTTNAVAGSGGNDAAWLTWMNQYTASHTIAAVVIPRATPATVRQVLGVGWDLASGVTRAIGLSVRISAAQAWEWVEIESSPANKVATGGTAVLNTPALIVATGASSTTCRLRVNQVEVATVAVGTLLATSGAWITTLYVGGWRDDLGSVGNDAQVDVAAYLIYKAVLTGSDLTDLESYLNSTYIVTSVAYTDDLSPGSLSLSGQAAVQGYGNVLAPGSFALTGQSVTDQPGGLAGSHGGSLWLPQGGRRLWRPPSLSERRR